MHCLTNVYWTPIFDLYVGVLQQLYIVLEYVNLQ